jgi:PD-(D/E)XK endonuclease
MDRRINRRQQGDLGEASAIEWLTSVGANVFIPIGHSPDFDLVAEAHGRLLRIQVKTSTHSVATPSGHVRHALALATRGGNQSWGGIIKRFDRSRYDYLFALTGEGRRWFIPSTALDARVSISLGGRKYSEFEIEPGRSINDLVYAVDPALESGPHSGEYRSGQTGRPVKALAQPSQVRILPPPFQPRPGFPESPYDRKLGSGGQAILNQRRRVTLPRQACVEAGLQDGDRVRVQSSGDGRILLERIQPPPEKSQNDNPARSDGQLKIRPS